jgi:uncharacterized protein with PIN domain
VLDSTALVARVIREAGYERLLQRVEAAKVVVVGVRTLLETAMD